MSKTIITRTAFCSECFKRRSPKYWELFLLYGSASNEYFVEQCLRNVSGKLVGYTPHIFTVLKRYEDSLTVTKSCGMNGCGFRIWDEEGEPHYKQIHQSIQSMTYPDWNGLVLFKDDSFHI